MRMPVMSGWEFAARYRVIDPRAPVIVMTAAANARAWADEIDADAVLPKPFTLDDLMRAVSRWRIPPDRPS